MTDPELAQRLLAMARRDDDKRRELVERGELHEGYHAEMAAVHDRNAAELDAILSETGWPFVDQVGPDAANSAWIVAIHSIGHPSLQRRCLTLLGDAVAAGQAPSEWEARLLDRIRFNERRPQVYGTILDWDENDELSPWRIEDEEGVDERRRAVGLPPLQEAVDTLRAIALKEGDRPPGSYEERQSAIEAWCRETGWLGD